jgi:hypothetical protein
MSIFCCCTPIVLLPPSALFACARPPLCFSSRAHCPHCREIHDQGLLLCDLHHLLDTAGGGCTCFVRTSICVTVRHSASPCVTCVTLCLRAIPWSRYKLPPLALATSSRQIVHLTPSHRRLIDRHLLIPRHRSLVDMSLLLKRSPATHPPTCSLSPDTIVSSVIDTLARFLHRHGSYQPHSCLHTHTPMHIH